MEECTFDHIGLYIERQFNKNSSGGYHSAFLTTDYFYQFCCIFQVFFIFTGSINLVFLNLLVYPPEVVVVIRNMHYKGSVKKAEEIKQSLIKGSKKIDKVLFVRYLCYCYYLRIFTRDCLFRINQTVINTFVAKHLW